MSKEFRTWLLIQGGVIAGVLLFLAGMLWYVRADIGSRAEGIRAKQAQFAIAVRAVSARATLRQGREAAGPFLEEMGRVLPLRDQLIAFPRDLERLARARTVDVGFSFGAETPATAGTAGRIAFPLTVSGPLERVLRFLEDLERLPLIVALRGIELSGSGSAYSLTSGGAVFFR